MEQLKQKVSFYPGKDQQQQEQHWQQQHRQGQQGQLQQTLQQQSSLEMEFFNKGRWFWDHVSVLVVSLLSSRALSMILWWLDERKINRV